MQGLSRATYVGEWCVKASRSPTERRRRQLGWGYFGRGKRDGDTHTATPGGGGTQGPPKTPKQHPPTKKSRGHHSRRKRKTGREGGRNRRGVRHRSIPSRLAWVGAKAGPRRRGRRASARSRAGSNHAGRAHKTGLASDHLAWPQQWCRGRQGRGGRPRGLLVRPLIEERLRPSR